MNWLAISNPFILLEQRDNLLGLSLFECYSVQKTNILFSVGIHALDMQGKLHYHCSYAHAKVPQIIQSRNAEKLINALFCHYLRCNLIILFVPL